MATKCLTCRKLSKFEKEKLQKTHIVHTEGEKYCLTSISGIATPSLDDKFLLKTATFRDNSAAAGPPLWPNSLNLSNGCM